MTALAARMADQLAYGFQVVPYYKTRITDLENGREQRNIEWTKAKRRFTAEFGAFTDEQYALLVTLFHAVKGSGHSFRFKDWSDYRATAESLGTAPGSGSAAVQLYRTYTNGALSTQRTITKPVSGTVTVYVAGVAKAGTLDTTTGLFTPTSAWAGGALTWTGQFDVPVRFVDDALPSTIEQYKVYRAAIELVEVFGE